MRALTHRRDGFGLFEALAVMAIFMILTAIIAPATAALGTADRLNRAEKDLARIVDAVIEFEQAIHHCPDVVVQLTEPLAPGDTDLLGETYSNGERNRWDGPYYNLIVPAGGLQTGIGVVDEIRAIMVTPDILPALVLITDLYDAAALDGAVDSGDGASAGWVQWTALGGGQAEVEYRIDVVCAPGGGGGPPGGGGGPPGGGA